MILRRTDAPSAVPNARQCWPNRPPYVCPACDVMGCGSACWNCGTVEVVPVASMWLGNAYRPVIAGT